MPLARARVAAGAMRRGAHCFNVVRGALCTPRGHWMGIHSGRPSCSPLGPAAKKFCHVTADQRLKEPQRLAEEKQGQHADADVVFVDTDGDFNEFMLKGGILYYHTKSLHQRVGLLVYSEGARTVARSRHGQVLPATATNSCSGRTQYTVYSDENHQIRVFPHEGKVMTCLCIHETEFSELLGRLQALAKAAGVPIVSYAKYDAANAKKEAAELAAVFAAHPGGGEAEAEAVLWAEERRKVREEVQKHMPLLESVARGIQITREIRRVADPSVYVARCGANETIRHGIAMMQQMKEAGMLEDDDNEGQGDSTISVSSADDDKGKDKGKDGDEMDPASPGRDQLI